MKSEVLWSAVGGGVSTARCRRENSWIWSSVSGDSNKKTFSFDTKSLKCWGPQGRFFLAWFVFYTPSFYQTVNKEGRIYGTPLTNHFCEYQHCIVITSSDPVCEYIILTEFYVLNILGYNILGYNFPRKIFWGTILDNCTPIWGININYDVYG